MSLDEDAPRTRLAAAVARVAHARVTLANKRAGRINLESFALPQKYRNKLSKFFRKVTKVCIEAGLKAVPCNGALLGLARTAKRGWNEGTCHLLPHDDDVDCFYEGSMTEWKTVNWGAHGIRFTDLKLDLSARAGKSERFLPGCRATTPPQNWHLPSAPACRF